MEQIMKPRKYIINEPYSLEDELFESRKFANGEDFNFQLLTLLDAIEKATNQMEESLSKKSLHAKILDNYPLYYHSA